MFRNAGGLSELHLPLCSCSYGVFTKRSEKVTAKDERKSEWKENGNLPKRKDRGGCYILKGDCGLVVSASLLYILCPERMKILEPPIVLWCRMTTNNTFIAANLFILALGIPNVYYAWHAGTLSHPWRNAMDTLIRKPLRNCEWFNVKLRIEIGKQASILHLEFIGIRPKPGNGYCHRLHYRVVRGQRRISRQF